MNQYCAHCGNSLDQNSQFCSACGALISAQTPPQYTVPQPAPAVSAYTVQQQSVPQPAQMMLPQQPAFYAVQPAQYAQPVYVAPQNIQSAQPYETPPQNIQPAQPYAAAPQYTQPAQPYAAAPQFTQSETQPLVYGAQQVYYAPVYTQQKPQKRKKQKEVYDDSHLPLYGADQIKPAVYGVPMPIAPQYAAEPTQPVQQQEIPQQAASATIVPEAAPPAPFNDREQNQSPEPVMLEQPISQVDATCVQDAQKNQSPAPSAPQLPCATNIDQSYIPQAVPSATAVPMYQGQANVMQPMAPPVYAEAGKAPKQKKLKKEKPLRKKDRMAQAPPFPDNNTAYQPGCEVIPQPVFEPAVPIEQAEVTPQPPIAETAACQTVDESNQPLSIQEPAFLTEPRCEEKPASQTNAVEPIFSIMEDDVPNTKKTAHGQNELEPFDAVKAQFDSIEKQN